MFDKDNEFFLSLNLVCELLKKLWNNIMKNIIPIVGKYLAFINLSCLLSIELFDGMKILGIFYFLYFCLNKIIGNIYFFLLFL
jgi:hypothetical protein